MTKSPVIFAGKVWAEKMALHLHSLVARLPQAPQIVTFCFPQDPASVLYTQKKQAAAIKVGIKMRVVNWQFNQSIQQTLIPQIKAFSTDNQVGGIMVQKPSQKIYTKLTAGDETAYQTFWQQLREAIPPSKDVDGLTPATMTKIATGRATIFPATMKAVLTCLRLSGFYPNRKDKVLLLGKSDLLNLPLAAFWRQQGLLVTLTDKNDWPELASQLSSFSHIISATGIANLIKGEMLSPGVVLVDVGEPRGDLHFTSCAKKAAFITPVPGGIGPLTVVSLLENAYQLAQQSGAITGKFGSDFQ